MLPTITIYANPETDLFDIIVSGSDAWDDMNDLTEQEATDEADAIQAETGFQIVKE
jgi:hypothetical protein